MSGSREDSPDWLRSFQAPTHSVLSLSSDSDSSYNGTSSMQNNYGEPSPSNSPQFPEQDKKTVLSESGSGDNSKVTTTKTTSENLMEPRAPKSSIWALSSDSEPGPDSSLLMEEKKFQFQEKGRVEDATLIGREGKNVIKKASKEKSPKKGLNSPKKEKDINNNVKRKGNDDQEVGEEGTREKRNMPYVSTSTLPLLLSEKVQRTKALVECEGESIDLSGDMGAVGRIVVPDNNGNCEMYLDLKGTIYKSTIVPSRTFCIVSFGQSEAKIEAIMNDFIQLKPQSNVYEAETMVEGTLDGFSFDSEDESDKVVKGTSHLIDQNDGIEEQINASTKVKSGTARKRGRPAAGKPQPPKKVKKKALVSKKAKAKK
ncbi:DNA-binding protein BIN4 [Melia azedarach]|uniref:DNA-binding protein BIN4 n=1 Tax=Melia azedarach TaxID=155640 RepID=A0ACC1YTW7_MELAZ|nr:DNA-binding protein BIN4 [Melia azedarach]